MGRVSLGLGQGLGRGLGQGLGQGLVQGLGLGLGQGLGLGLGLGLDLGLYWHILCSSARRMEIYRKRKDRGVPVPVSCGSLGTGTCAIV